MQNISWVPDIVGAAGPPAGFYDLLDKTVERAAPALRGSMPAGACVPPAAGGGGAGAKVQATRPADIVGPGEFANVVDSMVERVLSEGVRLEFRRFFVDAALAKRLGRPELNGSHMPCHPAHAQAGHRCTLLKVDSLLGGGDCRPLVRGTCCAGTGLCPVHGRPSPAVFCPRGAARAQTRAAGTH